MFGRRRAPREGITRAMTYPEPWFVSNRWWLWMLYRALTGRPMDGIRWTNATFWRSATEGEDHWWLRMAGWRRALVRVSVAYVLLLLLPALLILQAAGASTVVLQLLLLHLALLGAPVFLALDVWFIREHGVRVPWRVEEERELSEEEELELKGEAPVVRQWRMLQLREGRRAWEREVVEPVAAVAGEVLDLDWHPGEARRWVHVPRDYARPGGGAVEISLPRRFSASEAKKKALLAAVKPRLGMMELREQWMLQGRHPRLLLSAPPAPPSVAPFSQYRSLLERSEEYRPFLGVAASGELLAAEMIGDSPHLAFSAGSGAGKSMLMRSIVAQMLNWGWCVVILDWKKESHEWARGLDGVRYASTPEEIHDMCVNIGEEVEERKEMEEEERSSLPRVFVVREEWNMTAALLAEYWMTLRASVEPEERRTMPTRSPALSAIMKLDFAGRSFGMFDGLIAQRMSNRVFNGNTDIRENFGIRLLARYTVQTWKMLVPHLKYLPKPTQIGRWVVSVNDEATYIQAILISTEEARELARGGQPNPASPWAVRGGGQRTNVGTLQRPTLGDQLPVRAALGSTSPDADYLEAEVVQPVKLRKLRDLVDAVDHLGFTLKDLQRAASGGRERDETFPGAEGGTQFKGYLYDQAKVLDWARKKRAAQAAERVVK